MDDFESFDPVEVAVVGEKRELVLHADSGKHKARKNEFFNIDLN